MLYKLSLAQGAYHHVPSLDKVKYVGFRPLEILTPWEGDPCVIHWTLVDARGCVKHPYPMRERHEELPVYGFPSAITIQQVIMSGTAYEHATHRFFMRDSVRVHRLLKQIEELKKRRLAFQLQANGDILTQ